MFFFLLFVVEFTDFEGYVNFTSSLKKFKGNVDFVEVNINCEINTNHGISYDINRFPLLQKFKKDTKRLLYVKCRGVYGKRNHYR